MAIQKSKTLPNGASGNYWKIIYEEYNKLTFECTWQIALFIDATEAHSHANAQHLGLVKEFKAIVTAPDLAGDRTALGYAKIHEIAETQITVDLDGNTVSAHNFDDDIGGGTDV